MTSLQASDEGIRITDFAYIGAVRLRLSGEPLSRLVEGTKECIGACHSLLLGTVFALEYALAQTANIVCVRLLTHQFEYCVVAHLEPLEALS